MPCHNHISYPKDALLVQQTTVYVEIFAGILFREIVKNRSPRNFRDYVVCLVLRPMYVQFLWFLFSRMQTNSRNTRKLIHCENFNVYGISLFPRLLCPGFVCTSRLAWSILCCNDHFTETQSSLLGYPLQGSSEHQMLIVT